MRQPSPLILLLLLLTAITPESRSNPRQHHGATKHSHTRFLETDVDSLVVAICRDEGTAGIGGIWTATVDGATVGIIPLKAWQRATGGTPPDHPRTLAEEWAIILLDSPSPMLQPGTLMGWLSPAAKPGHYTATIYTKQKKTLLTTPRQFVLHLADDGHLVMKGIHKGLAINPWRLLPYMLRGTIKYRDDTPQDLDGFLKKWPVPHNPQNPRYL